jgi:glycosyltransferase involved in cell wall biosynthesis
MGETMKVSVHLITYNQERYIRQALASALMQETTFPFEVVVGDDQSQDGTSAILREMQAAHPERVRLLPADRHLGMFENGIRTYHACQGEYVAILEGDDFWLWPDKLQRQVEFLDRHPECAVCFHDALVVYEGRDEEHTYCRHDQRAFSTLEDLLHENFLPTSATMFRNRLIDVFPAWLSELLYGDWVLHIMHARHGAIGYIDEVLSVYRRHAKGVWTGAPTEARLRSELTMYTRVNELLDFRFDALIRGKIQELEARLAATRQTVRPPTQEPTAAYIPEGPAPARLRQSTALPGDQERLAQVRGSLDTIHQWAKAYLGDFVGAQGPSLLPEAVQGPRSFPDTREQALDKERQLTRALDTIRQWAKAYVGDLVGTQETTAAMPARRSANSKPAAYPFDLRRLRSFPEARPVFVLGPPRSGTSAMVNALRVGAGYFGWNEGYLFSLLPPLLGAVTTRWQQLLDLHRVASTRTEYYAIGQVDVYAILDTVVRQFHQVYEQGIATSGAGRWVDKTPNVDQLLALPLVSHLYPQARFIFMHRHPLKFLLSWMRKFPETPVEAGVLSWELSHHLWQRYRPGLPRGTYIEVHQEHLALCTVDVVAQLTALLDLNEAQAQSVRAYLAQQRPERTDSINDADDLVLEDLDWPTDLKEKIRAACTPLAEPLGYQISRHRAGVAPPLPPERQTRTVPC